MRELSVESDRDVEAHHRLNVQWWLDELPGIEAPGPRESRFDLDSDLAHRRRAWLAEDGGVIASAWTDEPLLEDLNTAWCAIVVDPAHRRRGVARELLDVVRLEMEAAGRPLLESSVHGAGVPFARAVGAVTTQHELCNVLDVGHLPADLDVLAANLPAGYALHAWTDQCPDDLVAAYAAAHAAMDDAPRGIAQRDDSVWSPARVRGAEERMQRQGVTSYTVAAVDEESGAVAGYTDLVLTDRPTTALQEDTGVVAAHRGHGLGLLLKAANLHRLLTDHPNIRTVITWNAETNAHMLAVNARLGFRPHSRWDEIELTR